MKRKWRIIASVLLLSFLSMPSGAQVLPQIPSDMPRGRTPRGITNIGASEAMKRNAKMLDDEVEDFVELVKLYAIIELRALRGLDAAGEPRDLVKLEALDNADNRYFSALERATRAIQDIRTPEGHEDVAFLNQDFSQTGIQAYVNAKPELAGKTPQQIVGRDIGEMAKHLETTRKQVSIAKGAVMEIIQQVEALQAAQKDMAFKFPELGKQFEGGFEGMLRSNDGAIGDMKGYLSQLQAIEQARGDVAKQLTSFVNRAKITQLGQALPLNIFQNPQMLGELQGIFKNFNITASKLGGATGTVMPPNFPLNGIPGLSNLGGVSHILGADGVGMFDNFTDVNKIVTQSFDGAASDALGGALGGGGYTISNIGSFGGALNSFSSKLSNGRGGWKAMITKMKKFIQDIESLLGSPRRIDAATARNIFASTIEQDYAIGALRDASAGDREFTKQFLEREREAMRRSKATGGTK